MGYVLIYRPVEIPAEEAPKAPENTWDDGLFTPEEYAEMERQADERDRFLDEADGFCGPEDENEDEDEGFEDEGFEDEDLEVGEDV